MIKKLIKWLKQPFYSLDSPEQIDMRFVAVVVAVGAVLITLMIIIFALQ
jgi:hypothetical protein